MKKILPLLLACATFAALAQKPGDSLPFRGCNTIIVTMPDTPTLKQVAGLLMNNGYALAETSAALGFVTTAVQSFPKNGLWNMAITARINGKRIEWSGRCEAHVNVALGWGVSTGGPTVEKAAYGGSGPYLRRAFECIYGIASKQGGRIDYEMR